MSGLRTADKCNYDWPADFMNSYDPQLRGIRLNARFEAGPAVLSSCSEANGILDGETLALDLVSAVARGSEILTGSVQRPPRAANFCELVQSNCDCTRHSVLFGVRN